MQAIRLDGHGLFVDNTNQAPFISHGNGETQISGPRISWAWSLLTVGHFVGLGLRLGMDWISRHEGSAGNRTALISSMVQSSFWSLSNQSLSSSRHGMTEKGVSGVQAAAIVAGATCMASGHN